MATRTSSASTSTGVELPAQQSGSTYFHDLLKRAVEHFPEALGQTGLPSDARTFKERYCQILPSFEAARVAHPSRVEIARFICLEAERGLRFVENGKDSEFSEVLRRDVPPLTLRHVKLEGPGLLKPEVRHRGRRYLGSEVLSFVREQREKHMLTDAAVTGFEKLFASIESSDHKLSLRGQRFVLLGAAAELSPVDLLLEAGADVLWIDLREPSSERLLNPKLAGTLSFPQGGANLLADPARILATIRGYARSGPVHIGCYAYAGGESQEWRLTTSMNAIVRALPEDAVASLSMLISPTTPARVSTEDALAADLRMSQAATFKRALERAGRLIPGHERLGDVRIARALVKAQGVSYQAAQLIGKMYAAEASRVHGHRLEDTSAGPLTVSANVAPITNTRSLAHPVFQAAFLGAFLFDVQISEPETTRNLNGLLAIQDVIGKATPNGKATPSASELAHALFTQQIHGGIYSNPYALDGAISVAAVRGLTLRPKLAVDLSRGLFR